MNLTSLTAEALALEGRICLAVPDRERVEGRVYAAWRSDLAAAGCLVDHCLNQETHAALCLLAALGPKYPRRSRSRHHGRS